MGDKSAIEWTDASWTPIRARHKASGKVGWHCEHVTPGCEHCYSETLNKRLGTGLPFKPGHRKDVEIFLDEAMLLQPLRWRRPRMIFVCSMTDLFAEFVTDEWIDTVFAVMALCPQHTFQVLTKRSARMRSYLTAEGLLDRLQAAAFAIDQPLGAEWSADFHSGHDDGLPFPNVWLGVSAEDQTRADERIPDLLATPAAVRFVSAEPLLGPIDLTGIPWSAEHVRFPESDDISDGFNALRYVSGSQGKLDWVIVGGESGPGARPMHPDWARSIRDQCAAAGTAYFFKQWGEWAPGDDVIHDAAVPSGLRSGGMMAFMRRVGKKAAGRLLDGRTHDAMPEARP